MSCRWFMCELHASHWNCISASVDGKPAGSNYLLTYCLRVLSALGKQANNNYICLHSLERLVIDLLPLCLAPTSQEIYDPIDATKLQSDKPVATKTQPPTNGAK